MTAIHIRKLLIHLLVNKILLVELSNPKKYDASTSFRVQSLISKNSQIIFSATPVFAEEVFLIAERTHLNTERVTVVGVDMFESEIDICSYPRHSFNF